MSIKHTDSDGFVDLGGYGFYVTKEVDMGCYSVREPVRNKEIEFDSETGDYSILKKERPSQNYILLEREAEEKYHKAALEALARGRKCQD